MMNASGLLLLSPGVKYCTVVSSVFGRQLLNREASVWSLNRGVKESIIAFTVVELNLRWLGGIRACAMQRRQKMPIINACFMSAARPIPVSAENQIRS